MAKQYTVIVTSTQASDLRTHKVAQNSGDKGRALRIKAKAGETYQLVEMQAGQAHSYAPQNVKVKRVGNDLVITFEGGSRPDIVIEGYYDVMPKDHKGLIGEAEDGNLYEYIPEDPHPLGLVQMLPEGGQDVAMALGAGEIIAPAAAAIAAFPLLGLLGLGAAGAAAYVLNKDDKTTPTNGISGKLSDTSDLTDGGNKNDDITRDNTPTLTGTAPVGSTATVTINGQTYPVTINPDGTWTFQQPTNLPDGTYYPILNVTQNGVTTKSNLTPFTIDTTPPSIAITSNAAALASGETATVTFTLSEAVADFAQGDVAVTGGTLSNFQQDPNNPLVYTATFTPASTGTSATISVANDKFSDAAGNLNTDGAEANNIVSLATNATVTGALTKTAPNDSGPLGDNITNDNTPSLNGKVPAGSTAKIIINGVEQPVQVDANGNWTYTVPNGLPDGTYTPQLIVTPPGSTTPNAPVPLTPFTIDTVPPSIVVTAPTSSLVAGQTTPITFTLSEPVADFTATDIAVTGGTLSNFVQSPTDPKIYTATFTPSTTGTSASITVPSGKFSDAAANFNTDGADTAPATTNTITLATNATASGGLAPVSDNSTGTPNDNTTNDATPELAGKVPVGSTAVIKIKDANGNVVGEGPATVNPDGTWSFTQPNNLPDGTYSPEVIVNGGTPTPLKQFVIDTVPPTVAITAPVTTLAAGASTVVTFTVSEGTTDLTLADIAVTGGTLGTLQQSATNPLVYTATYTSTSGGAGAVSIASNKFSDAAGNLNKDTNENPAATGATYEANNTVGFNTGVNPTPDAATGKLAPTSDSGVMGDNKTNDTTPELKGTVPPGSTAVIKIKDDKGNVVGEGPATVNPDGTWSFTQPNNLPDGVYTPEVIVNGGTPTPITPFVIDTTPPTIFIQADKTQLLAGQTTTVTFTLSEAVTDFAWNATTQTGDITVSGGTLGALTHVGVNSNGQDVYTAVFTPTAGSTATSVISVGSGKFSDAANNFNTDGDEVNNTLMLPTNTVTGGGTGFLAPNSDSGTPGDNLTNDDTPTITGKVPPGSTASVNINGKDYPVTVNPDGTYSYTIPDGLPDGTYTPKIKVTPQGGGTPVESDGTPFTIDTTPPTVLVSSDKTSLSTGQTATITFTLSEDSSDFTLADVTATGGTLSNLVPVSGSGKVYTATFTPNAGSTTTSTVKVDSLKFSDAAGNFNVDGADTGVTNTNIVSMTTNTTVADTTLPTIAISADRSSLATGQTTLVTFTLSEASSNFVHGDISVTGGTLGTLTQSPSDPKVYTAVFTPNANSTTTSVISVASNKFTDAAGNNNQDGADANNTVSLPTNTTPGLVTGALDPKSDTGTPGDNKTLDNTPTISGTAPPGSEVEIRIPGQNGQPDTVVKGKADENGQYSINVPNALPDGDYTPEIRVTPPGGPTSSTDGTPFTIDTTAPTILVASDKTSLSAGQTATITFTLSEASTDFTLADIQVTGGTLSNLTGSGTSYTATFTPTAGSTTTSVIHVASDKFSDAAGNFNADGADTDSTNTNIVRMVTNTLPADTTAPTIVVARTNNPTVQLEAGDTETITFTLSEASTSFNIGDIDTVGGTLSNFAAVPSSGTAATGYTQYTATFTPTNNVLNGSATVGVAAGKFTDNAGNANADTYVTGTGYETNNQVSFSYNTTVADNTPPTVALSRSGTGTLAAGGSEVINIVLSEASKDFDLTDIVVTGGTLSGFAPVAASGNATTGYTDYVVTFTPTANASGNATIGVLAGKFSDAANNLNKDTYTNPATGTDVYEPNNQVSLAYNTTVPDTTAPTIAVSRSGLGTVSSTETIYFTLSEPSTTFVLDDIDATGGTLSNLVPVASSGTPATGYTQYAATFTPAANSSGVAAIGVASDKFTDAAGNLNKDTYLANVSGTTQEPNNSVSFNYSTVVPDTTAPTVAVARSGTGIVTSSETITFTLSEASKDFALDDISVTGGTLAGLSPVLSSGSAATGYTQYTATFTPTAGTTGTATVGVASDKFSDAAGNFNKDTFVAGVAGTTQEVNNSVSFNFNNVAPDTTAPTIAIARLGTGTLSSSETITFTLSEASKDFTLADITVNGGTLKDLAAVPTSGTAGTGYTQYVATFTPTANASGLATIGVLEGKFSDAAGNLNQDTYTNPATAPAVYEANNQVEISYNTVSPATDTTPPTVIVARAGSATLQTGNTDTLTFTLSEPSLSFDQSDVTVSAGSLSNWSPVAASGTPSTGYTVYTATYTPAASSSGTATIGVLSDKFTDLAHNLNKDTYLTGQTGTTYEANNQVSVAYNTTQADKTAPKVEVLRSGSGTLTGPETIYFNFTEATTDFALTDITVSGGTLSNLIAVTGSGNTQYTATFTPTAASTGTATIGVAAGKFSDATGNLNDDTFDPNTTNYEANNQVSIAYNTNATPADTTPPTVAISRAGTGTVTGTETLVFTFSEPVTGFALTDIVDTSTGSAATGLSGLTAVAGSGNTQYIVTYTAPAGSVGSVTFGVKAGAFTDTASTPNANKDTYSDTADTVSGHVVEANNQLTLAWDTDTTAPTIAVTSSTATGTTLGISQTSTITFTLSDASADFTQSDVSVTGGTLSNWTQTSDTVYTATFTPTPNNSGTATIGVKAGTFNDLGGNINKDTFDNADTFSGKVVEDNNKVDIAYNTLGATFSVNNDTNTVAEDGSAITGNVKTNDSLVASVTSVSQGSTSGTLGSELLGQYGKLVLNAVGTYTYTIDNTKPAVQALKAGQQVTEVFSYTASDGASTPTPGTANLTITITGTNDAPVAVADTDSATEAGGAYSSTGGATAGTNPAGNVLTNDTDVDTGDTKTVSAIHAGSATGTAGDSAVAAGTATSKAGTYGSLSINADGSYTYTVDNTNTTVQALLPTSTALTDTFTYTVKDAAGATHQATLTVSITGANDAPQVQVALVDTTATTGSAFSYTFTGNANTTSDTFKDVDTGHQSLLAYSATLSDGSSLPAWLSFNATTRTFSGTPPVGTSLSDITVKVTATDSLGLSTSDDFIIHMAAGADTTPPTVAISSNQASLSSGQTATITFTFSEAVLGFEAGDIYVSSGTLELNGTTTLAPDASSGDATNGYTRYTATYTPAASTSTTATIGVHAGKFTDTASTPNANVDDYDLTGGANNNAENDNNKVTLTVNTTVASSLTLLNDTATPAVESGVSVTGGVSSAVAGTNPSGNVMSNDTAATSVTQIALSGGSNTAVTAGSTSASTGATAPASVVGLYGTLVMGADGSYTYTVNNSNATVNALQVGGSLTEVFTYTATDGTTSKTANLTVTINGTNDAPTVVPNLLADQTGTTGTAMSYTFDSGTFADVDTADTKTYTAQLVDASGNLVNGGTLPSWLTFDAATRTFTGSTSNVAGTYYVKVTDTDSEDATASDIFKIVISDAVTPSVKTALSINPVTGDNLLDGTEQGTTNTTISGKVTGTFAEGDTVTLVLNGHSYTATAAADGSYSVSVLTSDLTADTDTKIEGSVTGGNGGQYATAAQSYVLDSAAPSAPTKTALAIDPITADNVVLSSEKDGSNNITITGKVSGKFEAGTDTVRLTINGQTYTSAAVANDGTFSVDVAYSDLAADADTTVDGTVTGTGGTTATAVQNYALVDEKPPTVAVTRSGSGDMTGNETITFTLSKASTDFAFEDVTVTGDGTLDSSTWQAVSSTVYTATFIPTANKVGTASVGVKAGTFSDAAVGKLNKDTYEPFVPGTDMEEDNLQTMNVNTDVTPPTIAIEQITSPVTGAVDVTFTLSEASTDFTAADVYLTPGSGSLSNWTAVSSTVYTATFTPTANSSGSVTIGVAAGKFADAAGLSNKDTYDASADSVSGHTVEANNKTDFTYNTDVTPPTVAITGPSGAVNGPVTITFTLSEASADFVWDGTTGDIVVTGGGTLGAITQSATDPKVYTATYTPPTGANAATGIATINIASDTFKDPAGNFNKDGGDVDNHLPISYDTVKPTVAITTDNPNGHVLAAGDTTTVTFTFSEKVLDFTTADIVLNGGTLDSNGTTTLAPDPTSGNATTGYTRYTATFTPTANFDGVGSIAIGSAKFSDAAGNFNADTYLGSTAEDLNNITSLTVDTKAPTQTVTFGSMTKDSTLASASSGDGTTVNWTTADTSAGRLVSGFMSGGALAYGESLHVYADTGSGTVDLGVAQVNASGTAWEFTDTKAYTGNWTYSARVVDAAGNMGTAANRSVTVTAVASTAQDGADSAATAAYSGTTLNAMGGDDVITVTSSLQTQLAAGGFIDGGAGIDTIKVAAGTSGSPISINLETLTGNQTVKNIQEVEIFELQGYTTLQMSANDVLSLGGANASTMAPFSFASTQQVDDTAGGVTTEASGSTSSTGKVQMVIKGTANDLLKLDVLATDGTTSATGVSGNSGLSGTWMYKGTVQVGLDTYKVYDHSTTQAQVLVDLPIVVNTISPIEIVSIDNGTTSLDTGLTGDFVTSDKTLAYTGTMPVEYDDALHDVWVEIIASNGNIVQAGAATVDTTNHTWEFDQTAATALNDGTYTIRSTIIANGTTGSTVGSSTVATPHATFGSLGTDTHPLVIDTAPPTVIVARTGTGTLSAGQSATVTFTFSEPVTDFMWDESSQTGDINVTGGTLINFSGSGTTYTATFVPGSGSGTAVIGVLSHVASDVAGNENLDTYDSNDTGASKVVQADNKVSIDYLAQPTQTVTFSSMTKDSGIPTSTTNNHDWLTNDGSAGRLVSGTLDAQLQSGQSVVVYSNGVRIGGANGVATVNAAGTAWEITDTTGYTANWTYTAKVVDSANNAGPVTTQVVNTDFTEAAPEIKTVIDSANTSVTLNGTTANALNTVSGTGNAGDTVYLYDNTGTNLVGTTTVASNGTWTISGLASNAGVGAGSNTFSARQVDALGNSSVLSNLFTVTTTAVNNVLPNGDLSSGNTGFTTGTVPYDATGASAFNSAFWTGDTGYSVGNQYESYDAALATTLTASGTATATTQTSIINWSTKYATTTNTATLPNPDGAFVGNALYGGVKGTTEQEIWRDTVSVVAGKTYTFKLDYWNDSAWLNLGIGSQKFQFTTSNSTAATTTSEAGHLTVTFTALITGPLDLKLYGKGLSTGGDGNYVFDNFAFGASAIAADGSLVAGGTPPATANADASLRYAGGALDALDGNDTITASSTTIQSQLSGGGFINGAGGVDNLILAAGCLLNLPGLTTNQTVRTIEQVEVFTMQGSTALRMSANDVLSLGGANASTMSAYSFSTTTGGTASTGSTGKVQMVVHGTSSDTLVLDNLMTDGVTTNGIVGNTGLAGQWDYMGTTTANGATYKVYNQSTTGAQVLVDQAVNVILADETSVTKTVAFSSMTKDSGISASNSDWATNDGSAGRLVSGSVSSALAADEEVQVFANGTAVGYATLNADRTAWEFTDTQGYSGNWIYTAQVVNTTTNVGGLVGVRWVVLDKWASAPVILAVTDSDGADIVNNGTTDTTLSTVSGTGAAGETIYLYDNTGTNLVGTTTVASNGTWSISGLASNTGVSEGSNTFSARQMDVVGNVSLLSNLWTVNAPSGVNYVNNGDFSGGNTGFTSSGNYLPTGTSAVTGGLYDNATPDYNVSSSFTSYDTVAATTTTVGGTVSGITWSTKYVTGAALTNPDGTMTGNVLYGGLVTTTPHQVIWSESISVEAGKTYTFKFDYWDIAARLEASIGGVVIPFYQTTTAHEGGHFTATFTASTTGPLTLAIQGQGNGTGTAQGNYALDNLSLSPVIPADNSLVAGGTPPFTSVVDGVSTALAYTGGPADMLAGNDVLNIGTNAQTLLSTSGNLINGGAGVDTLKLATGTALNLEGLTTNQTVKPIQQVEVVQMQGGSMLALSANDVLSLGGSNASTMSAYTFSSGGAVTTSSTGKVQFVVQGTASDALVLNDLKLDGVTTNGVVGNTGLSGVWESKGTVTLTGVDGHSHTYKVYDHSETQAQVLVDNAMSVVIDDHASITTTASLSSMTKDSSTGTAHADWQTNDASAGRLVSGTLSAPLGANEVVRVYANGNLLGPVQVEGTAWAVTDLNGYDSNWLYTVQVYNTSTQEGGAITTQTVMLDNSEAPPVITAVVDSASASIADNGTTTTTLSTVSGSGVAGNKIYLYDNTGTNLVGTTTVAGDGTWLISGLAANAAVGSGSNAFAARQVDAAGNSSVLSNLWTVTSAGSANAVVNGDFSAGNTGFTTVDVAYTTSMNHVTTANLYAITTNVPTGTAVLGTQRAEVTTSNPNLKWTTDYNVTSTYNPTYLNNPTLYAGNPNGKMSGNVLEINLGTGGTFWQENMSVVAGQTYTFEFDYQTNSWGNTPLTAIVDGTNISFTGGWFETGHFKATYTATETKTITLSLYANNIGNADSGASNGDAKIDNIVFTTNTVAADGSLTAGGTAPFTANVDGASTAITFTGGAADMLAGNDVLNIGSNAQTLLSTSGNVISGGAGVDTLKLAVGTTLDLTAITNNQTVKSIEQVEVFTMQGGSSLTLSANDVLSLGGSNASTMSTYTFSGTTGGAASATSTGKVQMVINGTTTDALNLNPLALDGVTTNGVVGNTGLAGEWVYMGTTTSQINGVTYKVYNHSTTQAQVLTNLTASTESAVVSFSSMTKDSSLGTSTSDWFTADGSAGRLVSGTLETALTGGQTLKVYANGNELPASAISFSADGLTWVVTDTNGYNANWVYRADVISGGTVIGSATQVVTTDLTEAAPVITVVTDSASTSVAHNGSTSNTLSTVSGTGVAGDTIYLYDNSGTNLVGTTTVAADGTWSISGLATNGAVGAGSNTFSARMIDGLGNASVLSNLWTVSAAADVLTNGDFDNGLTGWTTFPTLYSTTSYTSFFNNTETHAGYMPASAYGVTRDNRTIAPGVANIAPQNKSSGANSGSGTISLINYEDNLNPGNPDGKFTGYVFSYNNNGGTSGETTVLSQDVNVVAGQTYKFSFDHSSWSGGDLRLYLGTSYVNFVTYTTDDQNSAYMSMGYVEGTFTAATTGTISLKFTSSNQVDFNLDNLKFAPTALAADGSLVGGGTVPFTSGVDGVSGVNGGAPISYSGGVIDMLAGDDVLSASTNIQTMLGTAGNRIKGGDGLDTLKLATGTTLDLTAVTSTQTVRGIDQVEIFELQGSSTLTLSANDVLSLGQTNAFGTASTKVQLMIKGTSTDQVSLQNLLSDGAGGNTGLAGMWTKEASTVTVSGTGAGTYNVYTHSTTGAQVLISSAVTSVSLSASPLMLDLDGDGVQTTTLADGVLFDLLATGSAQATAWVDRHDGLLAIDLNGDSVVNSGAELLGSSTRLADGTLARDGWQALAQFDANADGQIDLSDAVFNQLRVWVDADTDGTTDAGELRTLADAGIQSISLQRDASQTAQNGNILDGMATVQHTDGSTTQMTDAWLNVQQPAVLNLDAVIAARDRSDGVADMTDGTAQILQLNVSDVLVGAASGRDDGLHILQVHGDATDVVQLSQLFADGHTEGQWAAQGQVTQNGQTFNVYQYSGDASLQVLIDQHIAQSNVHLS